MKRLAWILAACLMLLLTGCGKDFPSIRLIRDGWTVGSEIVIGNQYEVNEENPYNLVETENGVDVVIHFKKAVE